MYLLQVADRGLSYNITMKRKLITSPAEAPMATGAPAALEAIAAHELRCRTEMDKTYALWQEAKVTRNEDDDVSIRIYNRLHRDYQDALEEWHLSSKKLLEFDTKVAPARREGEQVPVAEVKEIFRQVFLSIELANEDYILQVCQVAALCKSPDEFHLAHAGKLRGAVRSAIESAQRESVIPKWVLE